MTPRGTVSVGAVMLALMLVIGWLLWPSAGGGDVRAASGTVVQAVLCGPSNARDELRVELLDGRVIPARLDGCGHRPGEVLSVEVPDPLPADDVVVRLAGTGPPAATLAVQRLGIVGVAVAGIAGSLLAWRLRSSWIAARRRVGP
ncbi:MAG: hypothetical protein M3460_05330 [Actinomycetota bacterium]|nr:hypothetical protein [Actinomycetota bacterium]